jgi:hypothetical protein
MLATVYVSAYMYYVMLILHTQSVQSTCQINEHNASQTLLTIYSIGHRSHSSSQTSATSPMRQLGIGQRGPLTHIGRFMVDRNHDLPILISVSPGTVNNSFPQRKVASLFGNEKHFSRFGPLRLSTALRSSRIALERRNHSRTIAEHHDLSILTRGECNSLSAFLLDISVSSAWQHKQITVCEFKSKATIAHSINVKRNAANRPLEKHIIDYHRIGSNPSSLIASP